MASRFSPSAWSDTTLGEVAAPGVRAVVSGPFGSNIGSRFFVDQGVPVIRGNNLTTDMRRFVDDGFVFVTEEKADELRNCDAISDDLVFTAAGSLGQVGLIPRQARYSRYIISNKQLRVRLDRARVEPLFAFYWFASSSMVEYIQRRNTGSSVPLINLSVLRSLPLPLPSLAEQRAIAHILGTLDDKIELNRRMNATLEAMARALFQSWFVDFDPVRAKLDGRRPVGLDDATANLFPRSFQDSRLGPIPDQWEIHSVGELLELAYGKPLKAENRRPGPIGVYGSNGRVGWHDAGLVTGPGIVVGRKGNPGVVTWAHDDFYPIDTTFYVVPTGACRSLYFLYYTLGALDLSRFGADSAVPGLNRNHAYMSHLVLPPSQVCAAFDSLVAPLFAKVNSNERESTTLAILRDTLLPRLLRGELSVAGVEAQL